MLLIRKVDWYAEAGFVAVMIISIPLFYFTGFLPGLLIAGIVHLLSAAFNTTACLHYGFKREIRKYWLFAGIDLLSFLAATFLLTGHPAQLFLLLSLGGATAISIYYLLIYKHLIATLELKNELGGFTKS